MSWRELKTVEWSGLAEARKNLHQAMQLIASVGISLLEKRADDSHTASRWLDEKKALAGEIFGSSASFRLALSPEDLSYVLLSGDGETVTDFPLNMRTMQDAENWFLAQLRNNGFEPDGFHTRRHYEIEPTKPGQGGVYQLFDVELYKQMSCHFDCAHDVLKEVALSESKSSEIRCWPHHFDLAFLIDVSENTESGKSKSVGVGLSPGDDNYDQPYFYVTPWPYPPANKLEDSVLPQGAFWHSQGFVAAILKADIYSAGSDGVARRQLTLDFLRRAIDASKKFLGG